MSMNCPLCSDTTPLPYGDYLKCSSCGLMFVPILASSRELMRSYTGGWFKSFRRKLFGGLRKFEAWGQYGEFMQKAYKIQSTIQNIVGDKKQINILDIGCNKGFLLSACIEKGWNVYGIELVGELLTPFKNKYKDAAQNIHTGRFEDVYHKFNKDYFDVITAIDVVEHFENPFESIRNIKQLLKPNGYFIVQTPDGDTSLSKKEGINWGALKPMEHLFIFNRNNFSRLAQNAGFNKTQNITAFDDADGNFAVVLTDR